MADKRKKLMIGEDGELLHEAPRFQPAILLLNTFILLLIGIIGVVVLAFTLGRPAVEPARFYVVTVVKSFGAGSLGCGNWLIHGRVDAPQPGMQVRVWSDSGLSLVTLIANRDYDLVIQPQPDPITFHVALFDESGAARSETSDHDFAADQTCVLELDFRLERTAT